MLGRKGVGLTLLNVPIDPGSGNIAKAATTSEGTKSDSAHLRCHSFCQTALPGSLHSPVGSVIRVTVIVRRTQQFFLCTHIG